MPLDLGRGGKVEDGLLSEIDGGGGWVGRGVRRRRNDERRSALWRGGRGGRVEALVVVVIVGLEGRGEDGSGGSLGRGDRRRGRRRGVDEVGRVAWETESGSGVVGDGVVGLRRRRSTSRRGLGS